MRNVIKIGMEIKYFQFDIVHIIRLKVWILYVVKVVNGLLFNVLLLYVNSLGFIASVNVRFIQINEFRIHTFNKNISIGYIGMATMTITKRIQLKLIHLHSAPMLR